MNPSILLALWLLAGPVRADDPPFNLRTAEPGLRAEVEKFRTEFQVGGYRFIDASGEILAMETKKPAGTAEIAEFVARMKVYRRHESLEQIMRLLRDVDQEKPIPPDVLARIKAIVDDTPGLPDDVVRIAAGAGVAGAARDSVQKRYLDATRALHIEEDLHGAAPVSALAPSPGDWHGKVRIPAYFDDAERALGERLRAATISYFRKFETGNELLDNFMKAGRLQFPAMTVMQIQDTSGAIYSAENRAMIFNFKTVKEAILAHIPEIGRQDLRDRLKTAKDLNDYLANDPGALQAFLESNDVIIFHELTHAWQDKRQRLTGEQLRGNAPGSDPLEGEQEAFRNQSRFLHEKLLKNPEAAMRSGFFSTYQRMITDFQGFNDDVRSTYIRTMPGGIATLPEMHDLQRERRDAQQEIARDGPLSRLRGLYRMFGLGHGSTALAEAERDYSQRREKFEKDELPRMRVEGHGAMSRAYERQGDWAMALNTAYLAEVYAEAFPDLKDQARDRTSRLAEVAMQSVVHGGGDGVQRGNAVSTLVARQQRYHTGPVIDDHLRVSSYLDAASEYLLKSDQAAAQAAKDQYLAAAKSWVDALAADKPESLPADLAERLKGLRYQMSRGKP